MCLSKIGCEPEFTWGNAAFSDEHRRADVGAGAESDSDLTLGGADGQAERRLSFHPFVRALYE